MRCPVLAAGVVVLAVACACPLAARAIEEPERLWRLADGAEGDGLHGVAARALDQFLAETPRHPRAGEAWLRLARLRVKLDVARTVSSATSQAGESAPDRRLLHDALTAAQEALRQRPLPGEPGEAHAIEGDIRARLGQWRPALSAFRSAVARAKADPQSRWLGDAEFGLAEATLHVGEPAAALPHLERFVKERQTHDKAAHAWYLLGKARLDSGDREGGLRHLKEFKEAHPDHPWAADAERLIAHPVAAAVAPSPAAPSATTPSPTAPSPAKPSAVPPSAPESPRAAAKPAEQALARARAALDAKRWEEAATEAGAARKSDELPVRAEAVLILGEAEYQLAHLPQAQKAFQAALDAKVLEPKERARAQAGLGLVHERAGRASEALKLYEALARGPVPDYQAWARERIKAVKAEQGKGKTGPSKGGARP